MIVLVGLRRRSWCNCFVIDSAGCADNTVSATLIRPPSEADGDCRCGCSVAAFAKSCCSWCMHRIADRIRVAASARQQQLTWRRLVVLSNFGPIRQMELLELNCTMKRPVQADVSHSGSRNQQSPSLGDVGGNVVLSSKLQDLSVCLMPRAATQDTQGDRKRSHRSPYIVISCPASFATFGLCGITSLHVVRTECVRFSWHIVSSFAFEF